MLFPISFEHAKRRSQPPAPRRIRANVFLRGMSWDRTWAKTASILHAVLENPVQTAQLSVPSAGLSLGA